MEVLHFKPTSQCILGSFSAAAFDVDVRFIITAEEVKIKERMAGSAAPALNAEGEGSR